MAGPGELRPLDAVPDIPSVPKTNADRQPAKQTPNRRPPPKPAPPAAKPAPPKPEQTTDSAPKPAHIDVTV